MSTFDDIAILEARGKAGIVRYFVDQMMQDASAAYYVAGANDTLAETLVRNVETNLAGLEKAVAELKAEAAKMRRAKVLQFPGGDAA